MSSHLEASIVVSRSLETIPRFFDDPRSLTAWDKSVASVEVTCEGPVRVGYTFDTIGPPRGKQPGLRSSYRVIQLEPRVNRVELVRSAMFRKAVWSFEFEPVVQGTEITCGIDFELAPKYFLLWPLIRFNRRALRRDLTQLKRAMESGEF